MVFKCYSKTLIGGVFFEISQCVGGCVWYVALNILFRMAVQKQMAGQKSFLKSRLYETAWSERTDRPQVSNRAKALETGVWEDACASYFAAGVVVLSRLPRNARFPGVALACQ